MYQYSEEQIKLANELHISVDYRNLIPNYFKSDNEQLQSFNSDFSTSTKPSNLRYKIKDIIILLLEGAATAPDDTQNIYKVIFFVLRIIQQIRKLQVYHLSEEEAKLLVEMFRLRLDQDEITIEHLSTLLNWDQEQLLTHLNKLEELRCISYSKAGVIKIEEEIKIT